METLRLIFQHQDHVFSHDPKAHVVLLQSWVTWLFARLECAERQREELDHVLKELVREVAGPAEGSLQTRRSWDERGASSGCEGSLLGEGAPHFPRGWHKTWARRKNTRYRRNNKSPARNSHRRTSSTSSPIRPSSTGLCPSSPAPLDCSKSHRDHLKSPGDHPKSPLESPSSPGNHFKSPDHPKSPVDHPKSPDRPKSPIHPKSPSSKRSVKSSGADRSDVSLAGGDSSAAVWTVTRMRNMRLNGGNKCKLEIMRVFQEPPCDLPDFPCAGVIVLDSPPWTR